nr:MAG TPA: hypothetical protein [Caudoviricetes sp.]
MAYFHLLPPFKSKAPETGQRLLPAGPAAQAAG